MPISISQCTETDIYKARFYGDIALSDLRFMFARFAALVERQPQSIYRIGLINEMTNDNASLSYLTDLMCAPLPGSYADQRITDVFVSEQIYPPLPFSLINRHGKVVPLFHTLKQALSVICAITDTTHRANTITASV